MLFFNKKKVYFQKEIILVVGLGNPGEKFINTRHNAGFFIIDALLKEMSINQSALIDRFFGKFWKGKVDEKYNVIFAKPTTFMNHSGTFVRDIVNFFNIKKENIILIYDDYNMEVGTYKFKVGNINTTHNGVIDVKEKLGVTKLPRIKIGIGRPKDKTPLRNYVLQVFSNFDIIKLSEISTDVIDLIFKFIIPES